MNTPFNIILSGTDTNTNQCFFALKYKNDVCKFFPISSNYTWLEKNEWNPLALTFFKINIQNDSLLFLFKSNDKFLYCDEKKGLFLNILDNNISNNIVYLILPIDFNLQWNDCRTKNCIKIGNIANNINTNINSANTLCSSLNTDLDNQYISLSPLNPNTNNPTHLIRSHIFNTEKKQQNYAMPNTFSLNFFLIIFILFVFFFCIFLYFLLLFNYSHSFYVHPNIFLDSYPNSI